ncbi:MAG: chitobiase/beta-hexosaminidase C-terminal domain-containing protein [Fibrobacteria bacterium]|nr:chitobiase/beta-hexosaminidase C-terminal domain-containing protein [Fibrobacteria bacterium]
MNASIRRSALVAFALASGSLVSCDSGTQTTNGGPGPSTDTPPADTLGGPVSGRVVSPTFIPGSGTFTKLQKLTLANTTADAVIHYTTDGSTPTSSSKVYTGPLSIGETRTVRAIAVKNGMEASFVSVGQYVIEPERTVEWGGQTYRTVRIGEQRWMAENLNYPGPGKDSVGVCYKASVDSCRKYGRLYSWDEAMNGASGSSANPSGVQGMCPGGWHVPSDREWQILLARVGESYAGTRLKSQAGWPDSGKGTDAFGFGVLPSGLHFMDGSYRSYVGAGDQAFFWSAEESGAGNVVRRDFSADEERVSRSYIGKMVGYSVRCVED